jgi:hypothetical protein
MTSTPIKAMLIVNEKLFAVFSYLIPYLIFTFTDVEMRTDVLT